MSRQHRDEEGESAEMGLRNCGQGRKRTCGDGRKRKCREGRKKI